MNYNQAKDAYYDGLINETELNYYEYRQNHLNDLKTQRTLLKEQLADDEGEYINGEILNTPTEHDDMYQLRIDAYKAINLLFNANGDIDTIQIQNKYKIRNIKITTIKNLMSKGDYHLKL